MDLRITKSPALIHGVNLVPVEDYKYLKVYIDNKLDWSQNTDALYKKGQNRLYFLKSLRSKHLSDHNEDVHESAVSNAILFAVIYWDSKLRLKIKQTDLKKRFYISNKVNNTDNLQEWGWK